MIEVKRDGKVFYEIEDLCEDSKLSYQLGDHHYVTLKFTTAEPVYFQIGDYVELPDFGCFELISAYFPTQDETTGGYVYEMQMDAYYMSWQNKILKYRPNYGANETSFKLTTSISVHLNVILTNLKALGYQYKGKDFSVDYTTYNKDGFDIEKHFFIEYDSVSIYDALSSIADELECEWWVDGSVIYFGYCEMEGQVTFEQGVNMFSMSQSESSASYVTRLYAFGSDRNIPDGYFTGADAEATTDGIATDYLMLPDQEQDADGFVAKKGYLENVNVVTNEKQAIEGVVRFDDEYPQIECTVSAIRTYQSSTTEDDGSVTTQTFWQITSEDSFATKFTSSWILANQTLSVKFTSGALLGMEFEITYRVIDDKNYFEVVANDTYGRTLPDTAMCPKIGDTFFLFNWDATKITETDLIQKAQASLLERAKTYYKKSMIDNSNFTCVLDGESFYNDGTYNYHPIGEQVKLINPMFSDVDADGKHYRNSRIIGMEIKLDIPYDEPTYIVGEEASASRLGQLETTVDSILTNGVEIGGTGNGSGVYVIGTNDTTPATDSNVYSARRSRLSYLRKDVNDRAQGIITFEQGLLFGENEDGKVDGKGNAELLSLVVRQLISSARFVSGLDGEGYRLWIDKDGLSNLELDKLTVRQIMTVFELIIDKIRAVGGQIVVSAANGKIKTVETSGGDYKITFEGDNYFAENDLMRCQTFTGNDLRSYWVKVSDAGADYVIVARGEFANGVEPKEGDEVVLMGNTKDTKRQNLISISATEDGEPRIDVLDGVKAKNFDGCLRARLGNLDGITDDWFPLDNQPQGNGLYADNAYLRGTFLLVTGEDVKTKFEATEGKIESAISGVRNDIASDKSYLSNPTFEDGLEKWNTENEAVFFLAGNEWILSGDNVLSKKGDGAWVINDNNRTVLRLRNKYITQKNEDLHYIPTFEPDSEGKKEAVPVYVSFFYKCTKAGALLITFENVDKTGFVDFTSLSVLKTVETTDGYERFSCNGFWNGTGDFKLFFSGEINIYMLVLSTDPVDNLTNKYKTLFEQSERLVKISAAVYDKDETALRETGLLIKPEGAGLYAQDADGNVATMGVSVGTSGKTKIKLTGDEIQLEGAVTANGNFKILEDGSIETTNGKFSGDIKLKTLTYDIFLDGGNAYIMDELDEGVLKEVAYFCPLITRAGVTIQLEGASSNVLFLPSMSTLMDKATTTMEITGIGKLVGYNISGYTYWIKCPYSSDAEA